MTHMPFYPLNKKIRLIFFISIFIFGVFNSYCQAEITTIELSEANAKELKGVYDRDWLKKLNQARQDFEEKYGTSFGYVLKYAQQFVLRDKNYSGHSAGTWYMNFATSQKLWQNAEANMELEVDKNKGVDKLIPTYAEFNTNAGKNASLYIPTLYLEQKAFADKIFAVIGKTDLTNWFDTNTVADSADTQFLSNALGNSLAIPFPPKGIVAMLKYQPIDYFYFQSGAATVDAIATKVGLNDAFKNPLFLNEFGFSPKLGALQGNYRFIFYLQHKKMPLIMDDTQDKLNESGFSLSFDQALSQRITLFLRYGFSNPKLNKIQYAWSSGGQITEPFKGRKKDCFALGVAQSILGRDYRNYNNSEDTPLASRETMIESYYNFWLNDFTSLAADLQTVIDPDADKQASNPIVASLRMLIVF